MLPDSPWGAKSQTRLSDFTLMIKLHYVKNINNLRYTNDTILNTESKEELKNLLMKVKEESEKVDLKSRDITLPTKVQQRSV